MGRLEKKIVYDEIANVLRQWAADELRNATSERRPAVSAVVANLNAFYKGYTGCAILEEGADRLITDAP